MSSDLKLSPLAYIQWKLWCHAGDTEVGAFGIHMPDDPLTIDSLWLPSQECNSVFTQTDPGSWEDFVTDGDVRTLIPGEVTPVWLHTHPGSSATPSHFDEKSFKEEYGKDRLAVFAIMARNGELFGRVQVGGPKPFGFGVDVTVYWSWLPKYSDRIALFLADWKVAFDERVREKKWVAPAVATRGKGLDKSKWGFIGVRKAAAADQQGRASSPGTRLITSLLDDAEPVKPFEEWLYEEYEVYPYQLEAGSLKQAREEYEEAYGLEAGGDGTDILCEDCQWPLGEGEVKLCGWCKSDQEQLDLEGLADAANDNEWRGYVG